jgi:glutamate racemase
LNGKHVSDEAVFAEILPCFKEKNGRRTDTVALACTHYPLLLEFYNRLAPWPVTWVDPAAAIALRVQSLLPPAIQNSRQSSPTDIGIAHFTSEQKPSLALVDTLASRKLRPESGFLLPFATLKG